MFQNIDLIHTHYDTICNLYPYHHSRIYGDDGGDRRCILKEEQQRR